MLTCAGAHGVSGDGRGKKKTEAPGFGFWRSLASGQGALFLDADHRGFAHGHGASHLHQLFDLVHVGDDHRCQGRLGFGFQNGQIELDDGVTALDLLTFLSDTGETFTLQLDGCLLYTSPSPRD